MMTNKQEDYNINSTSPPYIIYSAVPVPKKPTMEQQVDQARGFKDRYLLTYVLFYALGVVTNISSNFFTAANDYWMYKFRDIGSNASYDSNNKTDMQAQFTSDYTIVSNVSYVVFILFTVRYVRKKFSILKRSIGSFSISIAMFILTCAFVRADTDSWQNAFFVITLVIGFFLTGMNGIFMVTLYELAMKFPTGLVPAIFSGQAICGIFAALVQVLALGIGGGAETTGLVYFIIGTFFVVLSMTAFLVSWKTSDYFRFYMEKEPEVRKALKFDKQILLSAVNKSKFYMISMVIVLGCTVMLHPGVISLVSSVDKGNGNPWNDTYFGPVVNFLFFYLFDYIGRETSILIKMPSNGIILLILSCLRIPLIPLILYCNAVPRHHLPVTIESDAAYIIFLIIFAFSNGYLVNLSLVQVPLVTNERERPFAMLIVLLLMILSLAICSATSSALVDAL